VRGTLIIVLGALLFGAYAIWNEPTKEERALAAKSATFIAAQYGNLPPHSNSSPAPSGKTYTVRAARHGLVVFVTFGLIDEDERARLRAVTMKAFLAFPELEAVSLESYEANVTMGKARFSSKETVLRKTSTSLLNP
jgi:hypothetical protein